MGYIRIFCRGYKVPPQINPDLRIYMMSAFVVSALARRPNGVCSMDLVTDQNLLIFIKKSQGGDLNALEKLLESYKPFVMKTAVQHCKRMLEWGRDDELSVGLIAFNSAIATFDPARKVPFSSYCKIVIVNRLKDYARSKSKDLRALPLDCENLNICLEGQAAKENFHQTTIEYERREEMERLEGILAEYSIDFGALADVSPKHRDSRKTLLQVARQLAHNKELWNFLVKRKQLPLNELEEVCGIKRKTLERGRKFIIASAIIMANLDQFIHLSSYVNFK